MTFNKNRTPRVRHAVPEGYDVSDPRSTIFTEKRNNSFKTRFQHFLYNVNPPNSHDTKTSGRLKPTGSAQQLQVVPMLPPTRNVVFRRSIA